MASLIKVFVKYLFFTPIKCVVKDVEEYKQIKEDIKVFRRRQIRAYANVFGVYLGERENPLCVSYFLIYKPGEKREQDLFYKEIRTCQKFGNCDNKACVHFDKNLDYVFAQSKLKEAVLKKQNFWQKKIQNVK